MSTKQSRKTAQRKERQQAALERLKQRFPKQVPGELQLRMMRPRAKQILMEGYKQDFRW